MASALLASRNEACWGEGKVYMRKAPNSVNPNPKSFLYPNPSPNPDRTAIEAGNQIHGRQAQETTVFSEDSSSFKLNSFGPSNRKEYVTYNITSYTRRELKDLKKRLTMELEQVKVLANRIESREFQTRSSCSTSGNVVSKEAPSARVPLLPSSTSTRLAGRSDGSKEKRALNANPSHPSSELVPERKGSKRAPPPMPSIRDLKRTGSGASKEKLLTEIMKKCGDILSTLWKNKKSWIFREPVDAVKWSLHDYHQIIKHPMDLGTVKRKLQKKVYSSPLDFAADVRLTFHNASIYNPKGHDVHEWAEMLLGSFDDMFDPVYRRYKDEQHAFPFEKKRRNSESQNLPIGSGSIKKQEVGLTTVQVPDPILNQNPVQETTPTSKLAKGSSTTLTRLPYAKQPKPKAKDPNKREMSYAEKQKLRANLEDLPQEKLDQVLQIIRRRNSNLAQNEGDEIEVDIEAFDTETLWELDRFVCNCKKMFSKMKRQSLAASQGAVNDHEGNKSIGHDAPDSLKNRKGETYDEDVDIGEEIPSSNFPPVEIEKDKDAGYASKSSSSGSSSSDTSSSSDSDSGSSNASDSDR